MDLVARHRDAGDLVLLTTATCRFLSELTAVHLGIAQLIATECETDADGRFTGRSLGVLNMREGKLQRLHDWLARQKLPLGGTVTRRCTAIRSTTCRCSAPCAAPWQWTRTHAWPKRPRQRGWPVISLR